MRQHLVAHLVKDEKILKAWTDANTFVSTGHVLVVTHEERWWLISADDYRQCVHVKTAVPIPRPPGGAILDLQKQLYSGKTPLHQTLPVAQEAKDQKAETNGLGEQCQKPVTASATEQFALDMARVNAITSETKEVVSFLSVIMEDEPSETAPSKGTVTSPVIEGQKNAGTSEAIGEIARFDSPPVGFPPILERLLSKSLWPQADFQALAREFHVMPLKIHDTLNEWADEALGDFILEGEDPVVIRRDLITKGLS